MSRLSEALSKRFRGMAAGWSESAAFDRVLRLLEQAPPRRDGFHVLTYHRVDEPSNRPMLAPHLAIPPHRFEQQMRRLSQRHSVVGLSQLADAIEGAAKLPERPVAITFDDGYRDFAEYAWPILKRYRLPVTLFVPTAFPGSPQRVFWWDRLYHALTASSACSLESPLGRLALNSSDERLHSYRQLVDYAKELPHTDAVSLIEDCCQRLGVSAFENPVLDWDALRDLAREGVSIAPHTRTHPRLTRIPVSEAAREIAQSRQDLIREIGSSPAVFAYPDGAFSDEVVEVVAAEGFRLAFTTNPGINRLGNCDPLRLRRIHVGERTTLPVFRARLLAPGLTRRPHSNSNDQ